MNVREFLAETYPIYGAGIIMWFIMMFWARSGPTIALVISTVAAVIAALQLLPEMVKRLKEKRNG